MKLIVFVFCLWMAALTCHAQKNDRTADLNLSEMVQPVPHSNKFTDPEYYVWCGSVTKGKDAKYYMLYSRWPLAYGKINGGAVRFGVAFADSPFGLYKKHDKPIFEVNDGGKDWMVAEDPFVWFQKGTYLTIVRDVVGKFTGDEGAWALMLSKNG